MTAMDESAFVMNRVVDERTINEASCDYPNRLSDKEITALPAETHLIVGSDDALIPPMRTVKRARDLLSDLASVTVLPKVGHGIELSPMVVPAINNIINAIRGAKNE